MCLDLTLFCGVVVLGAQEVFQIRRFLLHIPAVEPRALQQLLQPGATGAATGGAGGSKRT